jgi:hypothetical protein
MCAVGLGCDAFKIPMTNLEIKAAGLSQAEFSPYEELAKKLDITHADISDLYGLNDGFGMSFADVAKVAEEFFNSDQTEPVRSIRRKLKTEGKI